MSTNGASQLRSRKVSLGIILLCFVLCTCCCGGLTPVACFSFRTTTHNIVVDELATLKQSLEAYHLTYGEYPPNFNDREAVRQHMHYTHLRWNEEKDPLPVSLDPAEALVFWLRGLKNDPQYSISDATPGKRQVFFEFDKSRLVDEDGDGHFEYHPQFLHAPYVYFGWRSYETETYAAPTRPELGTAQPYRTADGWAEPNSFQIICAGKDNNFGEFGVRIYPTGEGYTEGDYDNQTSFSWLPLGNKIP